MKKLYILLGIILCCSCGEDFFNATKEIDLSEYQDQVSISARIINADKPLPFIGDIVERIVVLVSRSKTVLDTSDFKLIEDADLRVYADNALIQNYSFNAQSGYYIPDVFLGVEPSVEYRLEVDVPGEPMVTSKLISPSRIEMESVKFIQDDIIEDENESLDKIEIQITDPPGKNYYSINVIYKREWISTGEFGEVGDTIFRYDNTDVYNYNSVFDEDSNLFTDELFDGEKTTLEFWAERNIWNENNSVSATILLWSLPEEEYNYIRAIDRNRDANDNPFAEPSFVFSNIENGIGIFSVAHVESFEVDIE